VYLCRAKHVQTSLKRHAVSLWKPKEKCILITIVLGYAEGEERLNFAINITPLRHVVSYLAVAILANMLLGFSVKGDKIESVSS